MATRVVALVSVGWLEFEEQAVAALAVKNKFGFASSCLMQ